MRRLYGLVCGTISALSLPAALSAQLIAARPVQADSGPEIGGTPTTDVISLNAIGPGIPLRFGCVLPKSELVSLDGASLKRGVDYVMDYATGVVYLQRAQRANQMLVVTYRYDPMRTQVAAQPFNGLGGIKLGLLPGSLTALMGFGLAERTKDGNVLTSNVMGWQNTFKFGGQSSLNGLMLMSERHKVNSASGFEYQDKAGKVDEGHSQLILQNLQSGFGGGKASFNYQNVGSAFSGFGEAAAAGYDQQTINQLQKEKGLKRLGYSLDGIKVGSLSLTDGYRTVGDSNGKVSWSNFGLKQGGLSLDWQGRKSDKSFTRFSDLSETDRAQLQSEAGLLRSAMNAGYESHLGKLGFSNLTIRDDAGQAIEKRSYIFDSSKFHFSAGDQSIGSGFTRFGSLAESDKVQWGKEAGLKRQWLALDAGLFGSTFKFSQRQIDGQAGGFAARDLNYVGKGWSIDHNELNQSAGFASLPNLTTDELDKNFKTVASMYGSGLQFTPNDRNQWLHMSGINRDFTRLELQPSKSLKLGFDSLELKGAKDGGYLQNLSLQAGTLAATFRHQSLGKDFSEVASLMDSERARLGAVPGLDRTDFGLKGQLGKDRSFSFGTMDASNSLGGAHRMTAGIVDRKFDVSFSSRQVDRAFSLAPALVDPENNILNSLQGFRETEAHVKWQLLPNMKVDAFFSNADGLGGLDQSKLARNLFLSWSPDKRGSMEYTHQHQNNSDPLSVLFNQMADQLVVTRDLGRVGKLKFTDINFVSDGTQLLQTPGFEKRDLAYEAKLDGKTTLASEASRTRFDNGTREDLTSGTISRQLSKRVGFSLTETNIDRDGTNRDEHKRSYGFWYDMGYGLKVTYGYARQLTGTTGTLQTTLGVTPGTVGDFKVGSAAYGANVWDGTRRQANSNVSISTSKPLKIGGLRDLKLNFGMDTAADYSKWIKDNKLVEASGRYGGQLFAYQYHSQVDPSGFHGIDRMLKLASDSTPNRPITWSFAFKTRTLPDNSQITIRDYSLAAHPTKDFDLTHTLTTNPEVARPDLILGSLAQNVRTDRWKLDYKRDPNITVTGSFDEVLGDQNTVSRTGGLTLTFNKAKGSPLSAFIGGETSQAGGQRRSLTRYSLRYDQRPRADQQLSMYVGNAAVEHTTNATLTESGWTIRVDYLFKF